jgi:dTDP-glucose 4,6-dehydratase
MILITGGAGFIGINFVHYLKQQGLAHKILVADKLTYAANKKEIQNIKDIKFEIVDISNFNDTENLFKKYQIDSVINFAAESHVDNSIKDCTEFVKTNVVGTVNLLQLSVKYSVRRFLQISTDEVFGETLSPYKFNEQSSISPRNPYSASKASSEHFVESFHNTYSLPALIVNCSNNYGPFQFKEKLVPLAIHNILNNIPVPIYGTGQQIRDWIYVEDCCSAIYEVFINGRIGERYCIGGDNEIANIDLVKMIMQEMGRGEILLVKDRPGHDRRYSTDCSKIKNEFGWSAEWTMNQGIKETIRWINENRI